VQHALKFSRRLALCGKLENALEKIKPTSEIILANFLGAEFVGTLYIKVFTVHKRHIRRKIFSSSLKRLRIYYYKLLRIIIGVINFL